MEGGLLTATSDTLAVGVNNQIHRGVSWLGDLRVKSLVGSLSVLALVGAVSAGCSSAPGKPHVPVAAVSAPAVPARATIALPASTLSEDQRIIHVLNRLGYGPRPGDLERVRQIGLAAYIDRQLDQGRVPDDRLEASLKAFPALTMSVSDLLHGYPEPDPKLLAKAQSGEMSQQEIRQIAPLERRPARIAVELQA